MREHESKNAIAFANKLRELSIHSRNEQGGDVASVDVLVGHFERLSRFCTHIKAAAAANEFEALALALAPHARANVDDLVSAARTALATRGRTAQRARAPVDPALVSSYVARFQSSDEGELGRAQEDLEADRTINKDTLFQIVNSVSGHVGSFRSKNAAYDDLRVALIEQARFRNKMRSPDERVTDKD